MGKTISKKSTAERFKKIRDFPLKFAVDRSCLPPEQPARFRAGGESHQTRMNAVLPEAMPHSKTG
jgi:hypothetical protein